MKTEPSKKKERSQWWVAFRAAFPGRLKAAGAAAAFWIGASFRVEKKPALAALRRGLTLRNPAIAVTALLCALLPCAATVQNAAAIGATLTIALCLAGLLFALLRPLFLEKTRGAGFVLLWAGLLAALGLGLSVLQPGLWTDLQGCLPLTLATGLIWIGTEEFRAEKTPVYALLDGLFSGVGFTLILGMAALFREGLGIGSLWGSALFGGVRPLTSLAQPWGALLLLGIGTALFRWIRTKGRKERKA